MGLRLSVTEGMMLLLFLINHTALGAFLRPDRHTLPNGLQAMSGSDTNGGCSASNNPSVNCVVGDLCECGPSIQTNSALIDGIYPSGSITPTGDSWAMDFFTVSRSGDNPVVIGFQWTPTFELRGVELKLFNCKTEGTAIHTINVYASSTFPALTPLVSPSGPIGTNLTTADDLDCTRVTTILVPTPTQIGFGLRQYFLEFTFPQGDSNTRIYIAEARFSDTEISLTTEPPTTNAPTTEPPTTDAPTTEGPTTEGPTSDAPTTDNSTTEVPTSPPPVSTTVTVSPAPSSSTPVGTDSGTLTLSVTSTSDTTTALVTMSTQPTSTAPTSTVSQVSTDPTPAASTPTTDSSNTIAIGSTDSGLSSIVGPLVGVIVVLILVIVIGIVIVTICLTRNKQKSGNFNVHQGPSSVQANGQALEMDPYERSFANNQYYEETLYPQSQGGVPVGGGYFEVSLNAGPEPLYQKVPEGKSEVDTVENTEKEDNFYADIKETVESARKLPPYAHVMVQEAPPVPKKTPELYRALTLEREKGSGNGTLPVLLLDENERDVETVSSDSGSECAYQVIKETERSASIHSGLAVLSKPVFMNMESNPNYESPDIVLLGKKAEPVDEIYINPDAIEDDPSSPGSDNEYMDAGPPSKPAESDTKQTKQQEAEEIYTDPDKDSSPVKQHAQDGELIYTDPDKDSFPVNQTVSLTRDGELIYSEPDPPAPAKPVRTHRGQSKERETEEIYTDPDKDIDQLAQATSPTESDGELIYTDPDSAAKQPMLTVFTNQSSTPFEELPPGEGIYSDVDRENFAESLAIYDTVYEEAAVAAIFDPDSIPPVYENTVNDDDLFPYAPIYDTTVVTEAPTLKLTSANIRPVKVLGSGCFGQVILAETVGLSLKDLKMSSTDAEETEAVQVAVKTLKATASRTTKESFDKECKFMSKLDHPHVIRFLGVCREEIPYIMMEYLKHGDLNDFLAQNFDTIVDYESENPREISVKTLITMCTQISDAMNYLASHNYIHRDLAARNCLVGESNIVKLSDFGMSRSLYESHYYIIKGRAVLPVRWMSTECFYGKFSVNSDVWAFGVTMWEIFTLAKVLPYEDLSDSEVTSDALKQQKRRLLTKPESCPQDMFNVMRKCWVHEPRARATFHELFSDLSTLAEPPEDDDCV